MFSHTLAMDTLRGVRLYRTEATSTKIVLDAATPGQRRSYLTSRPKQPTVLTILNPTVSHTRITASPRVVHAMCFTESQTLALALLGTAVGGAAVFFPWENPSHRYCTQGACRVLASACTRALALVFHGSVGCVQMARRAAAILRYHGMDPVLPVRCTLRWYNVVTCATWRRWPAIVTHLLPALTSDRSSQLARHRCV